MKCLFRFASVLAFLVCFQNAWGDPNRDAYGIIQGQVTDFDENPLYLVTITAYDDGDSVASDRTDSNGLYTLWVPLNGDSTLTVDVNAYLYDFIPEWVYGITVRFQHIEVIDFVVKREAGPVTGYITDATFDEGIGNVYVYVEGDDTLSTLSSTSADSLGYYELHVWNIGDYNIIYSHPDFKDSTISVFVPINDVQQDVVLERVNWYVSEGGSPSPRGSFEKPFGNIRDGVDYADDDDTVYVMPGTMTGNGNRDISLNDKKIAVRSLEGNYNTFIDVDASSPGNEHRAFRIENDRGSIISGFTIMNSASDGDGGAIRCRLGGTPVIEDCVFKDNVGGASGGAIAVQASEYEESNVIISRCVFFGNSAHEEGGAVYAYFNAHVYIDNCTVFGNKSNIGDGGFSGGGISIILLSDDNTLTNCVFWNNSPDQIHLVGSTATISHCVVEGGWTGGSYIYDHDPWFCNAFDHDFLLASNSICCGNGIEGDDIGALGVGCGTAGVISGTVVDSVSRDPLEDVRVSAVSSTGVGRIDSTDSDGFYEVIMADALEDDVATVSFEKAYYGSFDVENVAFSASDTVYLDTSMVTSACGDYIVGDYNGTGAFNVADIVEGYEKLKTGSPDYPGLNCECPPGSGNSWPVRMDVNGSCAMNVSDIVDGFGRLKSAFPLLYPCPDCPPGSYVGGACCYQGDELECYNGTQGDCIAVGGTWYAGENCDAGFDCSNP